MKVDFRAMVPEDDWPLVRRKLGLKWVEDTRGIIAFDGSSGRVLAGCIINNWTFSACQVHFWIDSPIVIRRGFFHEVTKYVFIDAGRELMVGMVPGDNEEALKLDRHLGFRETHRIQGGFHYDVDYVVMEARREDLQRWMYEEFKDGRERHPESARLYQGSRSSGAGFQGSDEHADLGQPPKSADPVGNRQMERATVH